MKHFKFYFWSLIIYSILCAYAVSLLPENVHAEIIESLSTKFTTTAKYESACILSIQEFEKHRVSYRLTSNSYIGCNKNILSIIAKRYGLVYNYYDGYYYLSPYFYSLTYKDAN